MEILNGYGLEPNFYRLLQRYWYKQAVVTKYGKFFERTFGTERGVIQGAPVSPMISNIMVYAVVRAVLFEVHGPQEAHHRLVWASGEHNIVFYVVGGYITGCNPI